MLNKRLKIKALNGFAAFAGFAQACVIPPPHARSFIPPLFHNPQNPHNYIYIIISYIYIEKVLSNYGGFAALGASA